MELRHRIGYPRSYFHVMNRGARKVSIFADETDRKIFRGLLGRFAEKHSVRVLAWCLMPNHYHLQPDCEGTPLSLMMRDLDRTYARSFNARHGTSGCLFQGPFKSMLINDLDGLTYVNRYIHLNPVDIRQSPASYRWSSCGIYLGLEPVPAWMDVEPVMQSLRTAHRSDAESYTYYLEQGLLKRNRRKKKKSTDPLGDFYEEWIRRLEERCVEFSERCPEILGGICLQTLVSWLAHRVYEVPAKVIAQFFGYGSPATVRANCTRMQERIDQDLGFRDALESATILTTLKSPRSRVLPN
jgi:putative transposase